MSNIVVPQLGESIVEARVARWLKKEGERVDAGEPVVELETEKIDLEVAADHAGVITSIRRQEGEDVKVGELLATIDAAATASGTAVKVATKTDDAKATPTARTMAKAHDVNIDAVQGSGSAGRVMKQDVKNALGAAPAPAPAARIAPAAARPSTPASTAPASKPARTSERREERERMSMRRQTIARRLVEAQHTAAMLTTFNEIDTTELMGLRARRKEAFQKHHGIGLGIASFFVKASVAALRAFPLLNAEIQGDEIVRKHYYDIGMAVGAEGGLVVPVLRDADRMSFAEVEGAIRDFAARAGSGSLTLEDLRGGTFTITNGGVFGSLLSTPIINPPQVGILGLHKIQERPVNVNGQIALRPMMYVALSYDHRLVDGREAVQFLVRIKDFIEDPGNLLLES
ncbi:MAG: 2-oxoglutarate dehydrogenase complex dihydrolipoyllysine-residue succinyltransferase [Acidobacteria bacterium]|nr:2-oxoglutarate dehydrogenase complex dihydrolipoyllysine-residue succinyltransferase [Acidobacteriota bacterium]